MSDLTLSRPGTDPDTDPGTGPGGFRTAVRAFIEPRFPGTSFTDAEDIFALGFVNSLFAMELVLFIEKATGTQIPNSELALAHFRSVDAMIELVARICLAPPAVP